MQKNQKRSVCRIPGFTFSGDNGESSDDTTARRGTAKLISLSAGLKFPFSVLPTTTWPLCFGPPMNHNHVPWKSLYPILQNCLTLSEYPIAEEFSFDKNYTHP